MAAIRQRLIMYFVWLICLVMGGSLIPIFFGDQELFGLPVPGLLVATFGMTYAFTITHGLVFLGKGGQEDISMLAAMFLVYMFVITVYIPLVQGALWFRTFVILLIILGIEYHIPNWPNKVFRIVKNIVG